MATVPAGCTPASGRFVLLAPRASQKAPCSPPNEPPSTDKQGLIATSIFGGGMGMTHQQSVKLADEMRAGMPAAQPLPKAGLPIDIAEAVLYLVSGASAFVTGSEIRVDGGISIMPFMGDENQPGNVSHLLATAAQRVAA